MGGSLGLPVVAILALHSSDEFKQAKLLEHKFMALSGVLAKSYIPDEQEKVDYRGHGM